MKKLKCIAVLMLAGIACQGCSPQTYPEPETEVSMSSESQAETEYPAAIQDDGNGYATSVADAWDFLDRDGVCHVPPSFMFRGMEYEIVEISGNKHDNGDEIGYLYLPDTAGCILDRAFEGCGELRRARLGRNTTELGRRCFADCSALETVYILDGVAELNYAFAGCSSLTSISLPSDIQIHAEDFAGCGNLSRVYWRGESISDNKTYNELCTLPERSDVICDPNGSLYEKEIAGMEPVPYVIVEKEFTDGGICRIPKNFIREGIRYNVSAIGLDGYTENGYGGIRVSPYHGCTDITKVIMPDSEVQFRDDSFSGCTGITEVVLSGKNSVSPGRTIDGCTGIREIYIPDGFNRQIISGNEYCSLYEMFAGCPNIEKISLPADISLDYSGVCDWVNLKEIEYRGSREQWNAMSIGMPAPAMETDNAGYITDIAVKCMEDN